MCGTAFTALAVIGDGKDGMNHSHLDDIPDAVVTKLPGQTLRCIVHALQAANGSTMLSAVLSAPMVVMGPTVGVIVVDNIPSEDYKYCERVAFARLWGGVASGAASVAGGLAIGMTRECSYGGLNKPSRTVWVLAHTIALTFVLVVRSHGRVRVH